MLVVHSLELEEAKGAVAVFCDKILSTAPEYTVAVFMKFKLKLTELYE